MPMLNEPSGAEMPTRAVPWAPVATSWPTVTSKYRRSSEPLNGKPTDDLQGETEPETISVPHAAPLLVLAAVGLQAGDGGLRGLVGHQGGLGQTNRGGGVWRRRRATVLGVRTAVMTEAYQSLVAIVELLHGLSDEIHNEGLVGRLVVRSVLELVASTYD